MKKRFNIWAEETEIDEIKDRAKKQRRSVNQFVLNRCLTTQDIGDWWDNNSILEFKKKELKK